RRHLQVDEYCRHCVIAVTKTLRSGSSAACRDSWLSDSWVHRFHGFLYGFTRIFVERVVCTGASVATPLSPPAQEETWLQRDRFASTCDSDLRCRCSPGAISSDRSNRVEMDSCSLQRVAGYSDKAASNPNPPPAFAGAFLSPCRCHERCTGCKR